MPQRPKQPNAWLSREPSPAATGRIFLIPYSGCGAGLYRQWPQQRDGVEFVRVRLPGRETRMAEPTFQSYQELATAMIPAIEPYLDVPFGFFGHCSSALVSYEVSARLMRTGRPMPARLYVSAEVAPQDGPVGTFFDMTDEELGGELDGLIRQQGGLPSPELIELYLEVLRADVEANKRYVVPDPSRLSCPITAIGWTEDKAMPFSTMGGWAACGDTDSVLLEGTHHRFIEAPAELVDLLCAGLRVPVR